MTHENAEANCAEVEAAMGSGQGKLGDSLPPGWRQVYNFDRVDYSEGYDHVGGAWCRRDAYNRDEWFCASSSDDDAKPTKYESREAAMRAALGEK
jgi:hypothetical protein